MVKTGDGTLINGHIGKVVTECRNRDPMIMFFMGKNPPWDDEIFASIYLRGGGNGGMRNRSR